MPHEVPRGTPFDVKEHGGALSVLSAWHRLHRPERRLARVARRVRGHVDDLPHAKAHAPLVTQEVVCVHVDHDERLGLDLLCGHNEGRRDAACCFGERKRRHVERRLRPIVLVVLARRPLRTFTLVLVHAPRLRRGGAEAKLHLKAVALAALHAIHIRHESDLFHIRFGHAARDRDASRLQVVVGLQRFDAARYQHAALEEVWFQIHTGTDELIHVGQFLRTPTIQIEPPRRQCVIAQLAKRDQALGHQLV
mmetsp:Transcript_76778/g.234961  ORF Transcript_76778/g.234961 Transcript_76778/m.234961 type:complete len:251 (-) Transcript_76778:803-1555(-)